MTWQMSRGSPVSWSCRLGWEPPRRGNSSWNGGCNRPNRRLPKHRYTCYVLCVTASAHYSFQFASPTSPSDPWHLFRPCWRFKAQATHNSGTIIKLQIYLLIAVLLVSVSSWSVAWFASQVAICMRKSQSTRCIFATLCQCSSVLGLALGHIAGNATGPTESSSCTGTSSCVAHCMCLSSLRLHRPT